MHKNTIFSCTRICLFLMLCFCSFVNLILISADYRWKTLFDIMMVIKRTRFQECIANDKQDIYPWVSSLFPHLIGTVTDTTWHIHTEIDPVLTEHSVVYIRTITFPLIVIIIDTLSLVLTRYHHWLAEWSRLWGYSGWNDIVMLNKAC